SVPGAVATGQQFSHWDSISSNPVATAPGTDCMTSVSQIKTHSYRIGSSQSESRVKLNEMSEAPEEVMPAVQADASSAHAASFWSAIREALRGSHKDYTVGPIGRSIVLLAIPMVLEMCMESIFAVVDIKWVSYLGPDAMATVGL